jgi:hypothetical protein
MNKEKLKDAEYSKQYYLKHREKILEKKKEYYERNRIKKVSN